MDKFLGDKCAVTSCGLWPEGVHLWYQTSFDFIPNRWGKKFTRVAFSWCGALIHSIIEGRHLSGIRNVLEDADADDTTELHSSESPYDGGENKFTGLESL